METNQRKPDNDDKAKRRIMLVIEDDGDDMFKFTMEGDCERLTMPQIPTSLYSAAEFWAVELFKLCDQRLRHGGEVKTLNREERRKQKDG